MRSLECIGTYESGNEKCIRCAKQKTCAERTAEAGLPKLKAIPKGGEARWKKPEAKPVAKAKPSPKTDVPKGTRRERTKPVPKGVPRPLSLDIPYPVYSRNRYYRKGPGGFYLDPGVKADKANIAARVRKTGRKPMLGRLSLRIDLHPPDKRRRDIDNLLKAIQDGLEEGGAFLNDHQIDKVILVRRKIIRPKGKAMVRIERYVEEDE